MCIGGKIVKCACTINRHLRVEIVCTGLTWSPYNIHDDCNDVGRNCTNSGLLADMMSMWAKEYNFTWDVYADINGDWGLKPVSGT